MLNIKYEYTTQKKTKPDYNSLGFGKYFSDHMFLMDYTTEKGWHDPRIVPFQNLSLSPATAVFHYAQEMFEGLKAYKTAEGKVQLGSLRSGAWEKIEGKELSSLLELKEV